MSIINIYYIELHNILHNQKGFLCTFQANTGLYQGSFTPLPVPGVVVVLRRAYLVPSPVPQIGKYQEYHYHDFV